MASKKQLNFEKFVLDYLNTNNIVTLWWMSDFYNACVKMLNLDFNNISSNTSSIRRRLRIMISKNMIDVKRCGNGIGGRELYGSNSGNVYMLK